jgi:hypothetical protein
MLRLRPFSVEYFDGEADAGSYSGFCDYQIIDPD